jgi:teichuronic acid biosynthesis glycosyltransferase TuaH
VTEIVVVSLERWDNVWRRNQYLVDGLLRADPDLHVLFVEPAADPLHDALSGRIPSRGQNATRLPGIDRLWVYRPWKPLPRRLDRRADARLASAIVRAALRIGFADPILWINDPAMAVVMEATGWPTLYDITDDWLAADRPGRELDRLASGENLLLERAAEVIACSHELVRRKAPARALGRHPIVLIPNAVDVESYSTPHPRPVDLPAGRTAVYVGTLHTDRLDIELTARTAREMSPSTRLVLVGPNLLDGAASSALRSAGAVILGARTREEVIGYLQHADVLVVPHLVDQFTDSLDPIKVYEYLAANRPIVATAVAGFRDHQAHTIRITNRENFPAAVANPFRLTAPVPHLPLPDWSERAESFGDVLARLRPLP